MADITIHLTYRVAEGILDELEGGGSGKYTRGLVLELGAATREYRRQQQDKCYCPECGSTVDRSVFDD